VDFAVFFGQGDTVIRIQAKSIGKFNSWFAFCVEAILIIEAKMKRAIAYNTNVLVRQNPATTFY
jgi:hypothetical protein